MPRGLLAYNPAAGRYPSRLLAERAGRVLTNYGWDIHLEQSLSGAHITALAKRAATEGLDAFFIAGGDGSVNRAVSGLVDSRTALAVLPSGTANVWAQELGLPGLSWTRWMALEESARRLALGRVYRADVGLANEFAFLMWAGIGLDAFVVHRIEPRRRWEKHFAVVRYAASLVWNAAYWHGVNLRVDADGQRIKGHYLLALVSNVNLYAGGLANLSPNIRVDDGAMDLWLFEGETLGDTVQTALDLLTGRHAQAESVHCVAFQNLRIEADLPAYLQVDGEPASIEAPFEIRVKNQALSVLVPHDLPHNLFRQREQYSYA